MSAFDSTLAPDTASAVYIERNTRKHFTSRLETCNLHSICHSLPEKASARHVCVEDITGFSSMH